MKNICKRWIAGLMVAIGLPVMLTGCDPKNELPLEATETSTTIQTAGDAYSLVSAGTLTVGTCPYFPPFTYQGEDGETVGLDAALMETIAYQLGLSLDIQQVDSVESSLAEGKIDVIASAYPFEGVTEEQLQGVALTDAYYTLELVMAVRTDSTYQAASELQGQSVGCYWGFLSYWDDPDPLNVTTHITSLNLVEDLLRGNIEGGLMERHTAEHYQKLYSDQIRLIEGDWEPRTLHLAVAKDNTALLNALNVCIGSLKADGTLDQLIEEQMV